MDMYDIHQMRKEAFIKYVFQGNKINDEELVEFGLTEEQSDYIHHIYDWLSVVEGVVNKKF